MNTTMPAAMATRRTITPAMMPMITSTEKKKHVLQNLFFQRDIVSSPFLNSRLAVVSLPYLKSVSFSAGMMIVVGMMVVDD
jgi:hypothetical protein